MSQYSLRCILRMNVTENNHVCKRIGRTKPDTAVVCKTPGIVPGMENRQSNLAVHLYFDRQRRQAQETFTYVADPTIKSIHPLETFARSVICKKYCSSFIHFVSNEKCAHISFKFYTNIDLDIHQIT